jgi:enoyl-CoA hydratase/carnithine racemase
MEQDPEGKVADGLRVEREGPVVVLTLSRPERLNAVNLSLYEALAAELRRIDGDAGVRAVVLTGAGRAFCVGADLTAHGSSVTTRSERQRYVRSAQRANRALQRCGKPVVAAVNGHAVGAGLELALSSDYVVVAEEAKLRFPELSLGTFVGGGAVYTLAERVGLLRAKELLLLGDFFGADRAVEWGLANVAVAAAAVPAHAREVAARLSLQAPLSVRRAKRLLNEARELPARQLLRLEARALLSCMETSDWAEGVRSFGEKRTPRFRGE